MNNIKQWAALLCVACITSAVLYYLLPEGKIRKSADVVFSLFMLIVIVSVFADADTFDINIDYSEEIILEYDCDLNSYIKKEIEDKAISIINDSLESICSADYSVETFWQNDNNIYTLTNIKIKISESDVLNIQSIKSAVGSVTGIIPEVQVIDENYGYLQ